MERDFLGLNSKDEEGVPTNGFKDNNNNSVFMRGSGMQWPFSSNKVSALPQFMSYKNAQEDRSKKIMFDPVVSSGYAEAYDANQRMFNGVVQQQKSFSFDRQGSNHYPMNTYPIQHVDPHSVQRTHDMRTFSIPNHTVSISNTNPFFKGHISTTGHNYASGSMKQQQPLGGIPITSPHSVVPVMRSVPGNVEQRNISKPLPPFAQLTIFYGGTVNVYDDISPEKAQAIMYLAGNGATSNANIATPRTQVQALPPKPIGSDGAHVNQTAAHANQTAAHVNQTYPSVCSGLSSPLSITSLPSPQSRSGSSGTDELMTAKPLSDLTAPSNQSEPANPVKLVPAAVPQARKASLARFLEKRKERVIATMPYNLEKKSFDGSTTPGSSYINVAGNPELGFVEASREQAWSIGPPINNRPFDGSTTPGSDIINVSGNSEVGFIPASKEQSWSLSPSMNERNSKSLQPTLGM